jgi:hypothetical protein
MTRRPIVAFVAEVKKLLRNIEQRTALTAREVDICSGCNDRGETVYEAKNKIIAARTTDPS